MTRVCRGGTLAPGGEGSWVIPALPGDQGAVQCTESGGVIEETGGTCDSTKSVQHGAEDTGTGRQSLGTAALLPIRMLLAALPTTQLSRDLAVLNESAAVGRVLDRDDALNSRVQELIAMASQLALAGLMDGRVPGSPALVYDRGLHEWLTALARDVLAAVADTDGEVDAELAGAVDRLVDRATEFLGAPFSEVLCAFRRRESDSGC